jgi:hypothetical protein
VAHCGIAARRRAIHLKIQSLNNINNNITLELFNIDVFIVVEGRIEFGLESDESTTLIN